jgi:hypothetical protein
MVNKKSSCWHVLAYLIVVGNCHAEKNATGLVEIGESGGSICEKEKYIPVC